MIRRHILVAAYPLERLRATTMHQYSLVQLELMFFLQLFDFNFRFSAHRTTPTPHTYPISPGSYSKFEKKIKMFMYDEMTMEMISGVEQFL